RTGNHLFQFRHNCFITFFSGYINGIFFTIPITCYSRVCTMLHQYFDNFEVASRGSLLQWRRCIVEDKGICFFDPLREYFLCSVDKTLASSNRKNGAAVAVSIINSSTSPNEIFAMFFFSKSSRDEEGGAA